MMVPPTAGPSPRRFAGRTDADHDSGTCLSRSFGLGSGCGGLILPPAGVSLPPVLMSVGVFVIRGLELGISLEPGSWNLRLLRDNALRHLSTHIRQPKIPSLEPVSQSLVINPAQIE